MPVPKPFGQPFNRLTNGYNPVAKNVLAIYLNNNNSISVTMSALFFFFFLVRQGKIKTDNWQWSLWMEGCTFTWYHWMKKTKLFYIFFPSFVMLIFTCKHSVGYLFNMSEILKETLGSAILLILILMSLFNQTIIQLTTFLMSL